MADLEAASHIFIHVTLVDGRSFTCHPSFAVDARGLWALGTVEAVPDDQPALVHLHTWHGYANLYMRVPVASWSVTYR
jgi:hypothetical protein